MKNRPQRLWAVTMPDWQRGKIVGRRAYWVTARFTRRDAIAAWKAFYPADKAAAAWEHYRKERYHRVERVTLIVEQAE